MNNVSDIPGNSNAHTEKQYFSECCHDEENQDLLWSSALLSLLKPE